MAMDCLAQNIGTLGLDTGYTKGPPLKFLAPTA